MTWETIGWNEPQKSSYADLPLINKFIKNGKNGIWSINKIVFLREKGLFILETMDFKAFISEKYNKAEHRALTQDGLTQFVYAISIDDGVWTVQRQKCEDEWDVTDKDSCIIFEPPLLLSNDTTSDVKVNAPKPRENPFNW